MLRQRTEVVTTISELKQVMIKYHMLAFNFSEIVSQRRVELLEDIKVQLEINDQEWLGLFSYMYLVTHDVDDSPKDSEIISNFISKVDKVLFESVMTLVNKFESNRSKLLGINVRS